MPLSFLLHQQEQAEDDYAEDLCHTPIPGPTKLADPNRVRGTRLRTGTLYLIFFFKSKLVPVGMAHIL